MLLLLLAPSAFYSCVASAQVIDYEPVRPGRVLFEMEGISEKEARQAMKLAASKLPILTRFATRFSEERMQ